VFTRTRFLVAAAALLCTALAGCQSTDSGTSTSGTDAPSPTKAASSAAAAAAPEDQLLTAEKAKAALPTAAELPAGWTVKVVSAQDPAVASDAAKLAGQITYKPAACQAFYDRVSASNAAAKAANAIQAAAVATPASGPGTTAVFSVSSFANAADSSAPLEASKGFDACKSFTATSKLGTYSYEVSRLTPPALGDAQSSFLMTVTVSSVTVHLTVVMVQLGHNLISVVETGTSATAPVPYEPILKAMVTKLAA
jgi:hypothetical protein